MKRLSAVILGATLVLALAAPVSAAGSLTFHITERGTGAEGVWSTYPADGNVVVGEIYQNVYVNGSSEIQRSNGVIYSGSGIFVDVFSYSVDADGNMTPVADSWGFADGAAFSIDRKLSKATLSGSGTATTCLIDVDWSETCTDGTFSVSAAFTGAGDLTRQHGTSSSGIAGSYQSTSHGSGVFRNALATASVIIDGTAIDLGSYVGADMYRMSRGYNDTFICHGAC